MIMNKNFMIGFMYEGYFYCANVHKFHTSQLEYHITILSNKLLDGMPARITLKKEDKGLTPVSRETISPVLLQTILAEIEKQGSSN